MAFPPIVKYELSVTFIERLNSSCVNNGHTSRVLRLGGSYLWELVAKCQNSVHITACMATSFFRYHSSSLLQNLMSVCLTFLSLSVSSIHIWIVFSIKHQQQNIVYIICSNFVYGTAHNSDKWRNHMPNILENGM